ncbi:MAG: tetratricopeptide repeat protein [Planctomycetota bacterium]|jgi:tetratricopeptide (TPR) repeat protein
MTRISLIAALILPGVFLIGCDNPRTRDAHLLEPQDIPAVSQDDVFLAPDASEVDYVENLAGTRDAYRQALMTLVDYYGSVGNATKLQWAQTELKTFDQMVHYQYLQPAEWVPENLMATDSIEAADVLYDEAKSLESQARLGVVINEAKLRQALGLYNQLIQQYPSSDKIDDAAYKAGRIYDHLKNYELAAIYYQRTFQWNEATSYPARFRAASVMDHKLRMRAASLALYKLSVEKESRYSDNAEIARERIAALSAPSPEPEEEAPGEEMQE